jgi:hypothetical protein
MKIIDQLANIADTPNPKNQISTPSHQTSCERVPMRQRARCLPPTSVAYCAMICR